MINITNMTGNVLETKVTLEDGTELKGISKIVIEPLDASDRKNRSVQATLTITNVKLDFHINDTDVTLEQTTDES